MICCKVTIIFITKIGIEERFSKQNMFFLKTQITQNKTKAKRLSLQGIK